MPLSRVTNDIEPVLLLINIFAAAGTLTILYRVARRYGGSVAESVAGVALCGGATLFIGLTHQFLVEILQTLIVALTMLVAAKAQEQTTIQNFNWMLLTIAFGFLVKTTTIMFQLPFVVYIAIVHLIAAQKAGRKFRVLDGAVLIANVASFAAAAAWYAINWQWMAQHFVDATNSEIALQYGHAVVFMQKIVFWTTALAMAVTPYASAFWLVAIAVAIGLIIAVLRLLKKPFAEMKISLVASGTLLNLCLAGTIVAVLIVYSLQINEDTRFLLPLLPMVGALLAWSLSRIGKAWISVLFLVIVIANAAMNHAFAEGIRPIAVPYTPWIRAVQADPANKIALAVATRSTCDAATVNRYIVIGVEYPAFNANSASFFSAKDRRMRGFRCSYTSLGYAETDVQRALKRIIDIGALYVATVMPDKQPPPDFLNEASKPIAERLAADPRFELAPGSGDYVLIYRRKQ